MPSIFFAIKIERDKSSLSTNYFYFCIHLRSKEPSFAVHLRSATATFDVSLSFKEACCNARTQEPHQAALLRDRFLDAGS